MEPMRTVFFAEPDEPAQAVPSNNTPTIKTNNFFTYYSLFSQFWYSVILC